MFRRCNRQEMKAAEDLDQLPRHGVREYVEQLARAHRVEHRRSGLDDFAEAVTRLAGDDAAEFLGSVEDPEWKQLAQDLEEAYPPAHDFGQFGKFREPTAEPLGPKTCDRTERLLIALKRRGVINGRQLARLVTNCLRDR